MRINLICIRIITISFICQVKKEKYNRYLRCINGDRKAVFLYFMSLCEMNRANYLGAYAYYKNFFDRISADMAFKAGADPGCKKPNYKGFYNEKDFIQLYTGINNSERIIKQAHKLRNANPLSHSSSGLIDKDSTSKDLMGIQNDLDSLINQYSVNNHL